MVVQEHIAGLDIAMHDGSIVIVVEVSQPACNVSHNPKSGLPRKASVVVVQDGEKVAIRDVVVHQQPHPVPLEESQQPHQIAMPGLPLVAQASFPDYHCSTFSMVPVFCGNRHRSSSKSDCSQ